MPNIKSKIDNHNKKQLKRKADDKREEQHDKEEKNKENKENEQNKNEKKNKKKLKSTCNCRKNTKMPNGWLMSGKWDCVSSACNT